MAGRGEPRARSAPSARRKKRGLNELIERAKALDLPMPPVWLIVQAPSGPPTAAASHEKFLGGIILAADYLNEQDQAVADHFEFFVWVRPPHRSIGLGTRCVPPKLREVGRLLRQKMRGSSAVPEGPLPGGGTGRRGRFQSLPLAGILRRLRLQGPRPARRCPLDGPGASGLPTGTRTARTGRVNRSPSWNRGPCVGALGLTATAPPTDHLGGEPMKIVTLLFRPVALVLEALVTLTGVLVFKRADPPLPTGPGRAREGRYHR